MNFRREHLSDVRNLKRQPLNYSLLADSNHAAAHDLSRAHPEPQSRFRGGAITDMSTPVHIDIAVSRGSDVLAAGHDYTTVTDKITSVVLKRKFRPGRGGLALRSPCCWSCSHDGGFLSLSPRRRDMGHRHSRRLGIRHRQLRLVDRHRTCRHVHQRDAVT